MKKIIYALTLVVFIAMSGVASAQKNVSSGERDNGLNVQIGPFVAFKAGVNTAEIAQGTKTGVTFNLPPDLGVTASVPVTKNESIKVNLDLAYNTNSYLVKPESNANDENTFVAKVNYFAIAPSVNLNNFIVGFNFGIPLAANVSNLSGSFDVDDANMDNIATLMEIRLGGSFPLIEEENGNLNLNVMAAYMLTGMNKNDDSSGNPKVASLSLGVSYLFNIGL